MKETELSIDAIQNHLSAIEFLLLQLTARSALNSTDPYETLDLLQKNGASNLSSSESLSIYTAILERARRLVAYDNAAE